MIKARRPRRRRIGNHGDGPLGFTDRTNPEMRCRHHFQFSFGDVALFREHPTRDAQRNMHNKPTTRILLVSFGIVAG